MWQQILGTVLVAVISGVLAVVGKAVSGWSKRQAEWDKIEKQEVGTQQAIAAIEAGVIKTQTDFVDSVKAAAADGKLSKDEIKAARDQAKETAIQIATGPGAELLTQLTSNAIAGLIDSVVAKRKIETGASTTQLVTRKSK